MANRRADGSELSGEASSHVAVSNGTRLQISRNAAELFAQKGFHRVRMDDIAEATGITARALYRHYDSKQDLLAFVVTRSQDELLDVLARFPDPIRDPERLLAGLQALEVAGMKARRLTLLWQREARHLRSDDRAKVRGRAREIARGVSRIFVEPLQSDADATMVDVRSWELLSIVTSTGRQELRIPRGMASRMLVNAGRSVLLRHCERPIPGDASAVGSPNRLTRREQILQVAAREFRHNGYGGVRIDDIGGLVGFAGPAIYRYFDTKTDLLVASISRYYEWQAHEAARALAVPRPPLMMLTSLVEGYVRVATESTDLLAVSVTESLYLPNKANDLVGRMRSDQIDEWMSWLIATRPGITDRTAELLVITSRTLVDDVLLIPHLRKGDKRLTRELSAAAIAVMTTSS